MRCTVWTLLLLFVAALNASAQALPNNPVAEAARAIGRGGFKEGAAPETSPTAFKSDGKRRAVADYVRQFGGEEVQSKALQELLFKLVENYEKAAEQIGGGPDASGALAFSVAILYSTAKETELDDDAFLGLIARFKATLSGSSAGEAG